MVHKIDPRAEIALALWGCVAERFDVGNDCPVIAVKSAVVSDYNGVSLSATGSTVIEVNNIGGSLPGRPVFILPLWVILDYFYIWPPGGDI
jgi:hypothetical protein